MDFFGAQERARRRTWQLGLLFAAAVIALVVATNLLVAVVAGSMTTRGLADGIDGALFGKGTETWLAISATVVLTIGAASLYKYLTLRSGGRAVAELLGGHPVDPATNVLAERRLLNVVEEMAIASGIAVPPVYVLEEPAINAFAAGLGSNDAIVGVTRGTLDALDRDELQGVVAHEFSHILNGDMHINLRLIALLHGILFLGLLGETLLRSRGGGRSNRSGLPIALLGLGLLLIGYAGTFFGNLIKSAVNRQREFLADAAAVQFTRNPPGLADALKKIGGSAAGSRIQASHTREMSHLFFVQAVSFALRGLFATHPPLERRIRAIEPRWDGEYIASVSPSTVALPESVAAAASPEDAVVMQIGNPDAPQVATARARIDGLPDDLLAAVREPATAFVLVHALFLSTDPRIRDSQELQLRHRLGESLAARVSASAARISGLDPIERLTVIALAAPALKALSPGQFRALNACVLELVRADAAIDLVEWVQHRQLLHELGPHFGAKPVPRVRALARSEEDRAQATVLSAIAHAGHVDPDAVDRAFAAGAAVIARPLVPEYEPDPNYVRLNDALRTLRALSPLRKPRLIKACAACALVDGANSRERALLAGIAATLDCPLPPDFRLDRIPFGRARPDEVSVDRA